MSAKNSPIIEIKNLHKYFGKVEALRGVDLTVESGKVIVVVGPSGSGKSTLLRCINHLEVETVGEVWVDGKRLNERNKNINEIRAEIGMVFQLFNLFPHLTALDNIVLTPHVAGLTAEAVAGMSLSAARQILQALSGDCPPHMVNREIWPAAAARAQAAALTL